jgi:hypothetical protein
VRKAISLFRSCSFDACPCGKAALCHEDVVKKAMPIAGEWETYEQIRKEGGITLQSAPAIWVRQAEKELGLIRTKDSKTHRILWWIHKRTNRGETSLHNRKTRSSPTSWNSSEWRCKTNHRKSRSTTSVRGGTISCQGGVSRQLLPLLPASRGLRICRN